MKTEINKEDVAAQIKTGLKFYEVGGRTFLGTKEGKTIRGIEVSSTSLTKRSVTDYIKAMNEETLVAFTISKATDLFTYELSAENEIVLDTVIATYNLALSRSEQWLVNRVFTEYMGKA